MITRAACTCGSLRKASRRVSQFYDVALAPVGIKSTQYAILHEVERSRVAGPMTMRELAALMVMDRSTLGHNLRPLERDGLLLLRADVRDKRRRNVTLTRKGLAKLQNARKLWRSAEDRFERMFGKRHSAALRDALLYIANNEELNSLAVT